MSFCASWLVVFWEQMYVIGCLKQSQHGSRSSRFPFNYTFIAGARVSWNNLQCGLRLLIHWICHFGWVSWPGFNLRPGLIWDRGCIRGNMVCSDCKNVTSRATYTVDNLLWREEIVIDHCKVRGPSFDLFVCLWHVFVYELNNGASWSFQVRHTVIDEYLCTVAGCALGTDVCHWMFLKRLTWFKVNNMAVQTITSQSVCSIHITSSKLICFIGWFFIDLFSNNITHFT